MTGVTDLLDALLDIIHVGGLEVVVVGGAAGHPATTTTARLSAPATTF